ncbi:alpha/beta fold hydrolase [Gracilibacillus salinarum]|uniref:Alpha/beta hydrolase n=1 Tax=Gracilibacillus salinarum TaxID=2932255 RepID=A0ABY4GGS2_9BACI|nr:alpha/beta hydrolase [Gracilibacillus salinarum]UOQ83531.1 alpha/beta hydrolase [Gracilibacillus salinarum]
MNYIFVHGLGQNWSSWNSTTDHLDFASNVYCPDLFSLLGTDEPTYHNLYQSFYAYCENFQDPINLCGLSLGAILSLHYAIDRPDKVNSLVLIAAQYKMPKLLLTIQNLMFYFIPKSVFLNMGTNKQQFIGLIKSMKQLDFTNRLADIQCDSFIMCGEKDFANKRAAKNLSQTIEGARFVVVEDAGHELNTDNPGKLAELVTEFWGTDCHKN